MQSIFCLHKKEKGREVRHMTEDSKENAPNQTREEEKKKKPEEGMPFCTQAPSAEHGRGTEGEEPCDDGRSGDYEK
jgi:hypothetical protein